MGRTDLARFRKTATSVTPPAFFPHHLRHLLQQTDKSHPFHSALHAIRSIHDASSQRAQVAAVKLLGVNLYDTHKSANPNASPCPLSESERNENSNLIVPVLVYFLFKAPDAIPGLISASLRALLRVSSINLRPVNDAFDSFFDDLESIPSQLPSSPHTNVIPDKLSVVSLSCTINTTAVMLSEHHSRMLIYSRANRVKAILALANFFTDLFILSSSTRTATQTFGIDTNVVEAACDSSMKAVQDIFNEFYSQNFGLPFDHSGLQKDFCIRNSVASCRRLLCLESAPRSCSLACAVTFVTGHALLNCDHANVDCLVKTLREGILFKVPTYPPFSQLSIIRALLEAPIAESALSQLLFPQSPFNPSSPNEDTIFGMLISLTSASSDVHFRFLSMEAVISCIRKVPVGNALNEFCRDAVLSLVYQRWEEPFAGVTSQIRDTMDALIATDGGQPKALEFWKSMTSNLLQGDWRCKGMYAPLGVLIRRVGAQALLEIQPDCQTNAMCAMASDSRLTKAVADWLEAFWDVLKRECRCNTELFVNLTAPHVVDALLHSTNQPLRERVAEHVLPVYMRSEEKQSIADTGRALLSWMSSSPSVSRPIINRGAFVRGSVMVMSVARRNGVSSIVDFEDKSVRELLTDALGSTEEDLRAAAFDVVVTSGVPTEPITQAEFDIILSYLPIALMPGGTPADRSRFRHSMRRLLERVSICQKAAREATGGWWSRQRKTRTRSRPLDCTASKVAADDLEAERVALLARIDKFIERCVGILFAGSFPGAAFGRRTSALEVIHLLVANLGVPALLRNCAGDEGHTCLAALTSGLLDEWERPRRATMDVLQSLSPPLPGLSSISEAGSLMRRARLLLDSPRQKDVDSAASLSHVIFQKVVLCVEQIHSNVEGDINDVDYLLQCFDDEAGTLENENGLRCEAKSISPVLTYALGILRSLDKRIDLAKKDFMLACARGLFHGQFLLLRYLVQDFPWKDDLMEKMKAPLAYFIHRFVQLADRCIVIALDGVSFQKQSDLTFGKVTGSHVSENNDDENFEDGAFDQADNRDAVFLQHGKQLESTSCFLSAKELCVALGVLCHQAPFDEGLDVRRDKDIEHLNFLDQTTIERIGDLYISVFVGTRHWGVIDGASEGFQLLCERLLSSSALHFRALPKKWAMEIITRALSGELYVLRRSAGVPWFIGAVVNAESAVNRRSHESPILNSIIMMLLEHMHSANAQERTLQSINEGMDKLVEGSMSHALNLLRAVFLNSNIGSNTLKYLESATICCIDAFCSSSWLVRNSSLMLYSALIRRGIGVCREHKDEDTFISTIRTQLACSSSKLKTENEAATISSFKAASGTSATLEGARRLSGTTAFQFFSRHPKLHPFLLSHLEKAVQLSEGEEDHPVLFPTLYLLSCLSPNTNEDPSTQISMSKFINVVDKCTRWKSEYVRRAAAAARVALIEDCNQVPDIVRDILIGLPEEPVSLTIRPNNHDISRNLDGSNGSNSLAAYEERKAVLEQNLLHGELLTITSILQNTVSLMSPASKTRLLDSLSDLLPKVSWIAVERSKNPCSITRACIIDLVSLSYRLAHEERCDSILKLVYNIAEKVASDDTLAFGSLSQIGFSAFRSKVLKFYGALVTRKYKLGEFNLRQVLEIFCTRMESQTEDEKGLVACMEACSELLSSSSIEESDRLASFNVSKRLWGIVERFLFGKRRTEPLVACLNLFLCLLDRAVGTDFNWKLKSTYVFKFAEEDTCIDVQERAIVVIGHLVGLGYYKDDSIARWTNLINKGRYSQSASVRMAVCSSIRKSFACTQPFMREIVTHGYLTLAQMLEDDSAQVRKHAMNISLQCLAAGAHSNVLESHFLPTLLSIFKRLSNSYGDCSRLFKHLNALLSTSSEDNLMSVIIQLICQDQTQFVESRENLKNEFFTTDEIAEHDEAEERRLFKLEQVCGDGEIVLQMHLITWCYARLLLKMLQDVDKVSEINKSSQFSQKIASMTECNVHQLERTIEKVNGMTDDGEGSMVGSGMFGTEGFLLVERDILRVYLSLCCMFCSDAIDHDIEVTRSRDLLDDLLLSCNNHCHPILKKSISGLADFSRKTDFFRRGQLDDGRILFLLPLKDLSITV